MASLYKWIRDQQKKHAPWYIAYRDRAGKRRTVKGFTDKALTEKLAMKLETEARLVAKATNCECQPTEIKPSDVEE
jgi:hypothetical protein